MAAKRRALWQVVAAQLLLVAVPLYGSLPDLAAATPARSARPSADSVNILIPVEREDDLALVAVCAITPLREPPHGPEPAVARTHWEPKTRLRVSSSANETQPLANLWFSCEIAVGVSVKSYAYDPLYRLTDETVTQGTAPGSPVRWHNGFTYDPVGNRQRQDRTEVSGSSRVVTYGYDERDRLTSETSGGPTSYGWDENGNQVSKSGLDGATYTWDFESRLTRVVLANGTTVNHVYDVDGTRVRTTTTPAGGSPTVVDYLVDPAQRTGAAGRGLVLSQVVAESDASGNVTAYHVRGDELLATLRPNAAPPGPGVEPWVARYFHADGLGSIRALTDEAGAVTDRYDFEAFGTLISHQGEDPNAYLFAGEAFDPSSGFYYNRARWLEPGLGRFLSSDSFEGAPFDPSSLHKYTYAGSNPVLEVDPLGLYEGLGGLLVSMGIQAILRGMAYGFIGGALIGGADAALRGEDPEGVLVAAGKAGLIGAVLGPLIKIRFIGTALILLGEIGAVVGVVDAIEQDNYGLAVFRGALALAGAVAFFRSAPSIEVPAGGRLGRADTRAEVKQIGDVLESRGWRITGGGGRLPEEYLPGPGGSRSGSNWIDITAQKNGRTLRINTVDTRANGVTPTTREAAAAALIRSKKPDDHLLLIPKHSTGEM